MDKNENIMTDQEFLKELREVLDGDYYNAQEEDWAIMQFINSKTEPIAKQLASARKESEELKKINSTLSDIAKENGVTCINLQSDLSECKAALEEIAFQCDRPGVMNDNWLRNLCNETLTKLQTPSQNNQ